MMKAKTQGRDGVSPISGVAPPKHTQFGQPNGNPQGRGFWRKEDSPRYKLEQMLKLSQSELQAVIDDDTQSMFAIKLARCILADDWKTLEGMMNQTYGYPKQSIEQVNLEPPKPLEDLRKKK